MVETWREYVGDRRATIIFGGLRDKDLEGMIAILSTIATRFLSVPIRSQRAAAPGRNSIHRAGIPLSHSMRLRRAGLATRLSFRRSDPGHRLPVSGWRTPCHPAIVPRHIASQQPVRIDNVYNYVGYLRCPTRCLSRALKINLTCAMPAVRQESPVLFNSRDPREQKFFLTLTFFVSTRSAIA